MFTQLLPPPPLPPAVHAGHPPRPPPLAHADRTPHPSPISHSFPTISRTRIPETTPLSLIANLAKREVRRITVANPRVVNRSKIAMTRSKLATTESLYSKIAKRETENCACFKAQVVQNAAASTWKVSGSQLTKRSVRVRHHASAYHATIPLLGLASSNI
jgi:hypothetical protein